MGATKSSAGDEKCDAHGFLFSEVKKERKCGQMLAIEIFLATGRNLYLNILIEQTGWINLMNGLLLFTKLTVTKFFLKYRITSCTLHRFNDIYNRLEHFIIFVNSWDSARHSPCINLLDFFVVCSLKYHTLLIKCFGCVLNLRTECFIRC